MKALSQSVVVAAATSVILMGCNPEGEGSASSSFSLSSVALKSPTYVIVDGDAEMAASIFDDSEMGFETGMDAGLYRTFGADTGQRMLEGFSNRETQSETIDCFSGSMTVSVSSDDIDSNGNPNTNGSMTFTSNYNNCYDDWSEETVNGSVDVDFTWKGYNPNSEMGFDAMEVVMKFSDLSVSDLYDSSTLDGAMVFDLAQSAASIEWALSVSGSETNNQIITTKTTQAITADMATGSASGAWVVNGANGSKAEVTLTDSGYSVSVNGGAAVNVAMYY